MKPSERIHQIASKSVPVGYAYSVTAEHVAQYLDEQALDRPEPPDEPEPVPRRYSLELVCQEGRVGGAPTIGESRLSVWAVLSFMQAGYPDERILEEYPSIVGGIDSIRVLRMLWNDSPQLRNAAEPR